jgi:hypothetical protein
MATTLVDFRVVGLGVAITVLSCMMLQARTPARSIVGGQRLDAAISTLETQVGRQPEDAAALHALVEAYLLRGAPGLAQAALDRAPESLRQAPRIADLRVRSLTELGRPQLAFAVQNTVLAACSRAGCTPELEGRGRHRLEWLRRMLELDVGDPRLEPERALLAYRLASRQVKLELH